jgi:hypothetical protein
MKKYIYSLFMLAFALTTISSCKVDEGTDPGNDSEPVATIYQFKAENPYDSDSDVKIRVAANSATAEAYIFAEKVADKTARLASLGKDGYMDYVVTKGVKLDKIAGSSVQDYTVTGMNGEYAITVVAKNGDRKMSAETSFTGVLWNTIATGTYTFCAKSVRFFGTSVETSLQVNASSPTIYRFKNVYGEGVNLVFTLTDQKGKDADGVPFTYLRVAAQATGATFGTYGNVSVRDLATWQESDDYLDNRLYSGNKIKLWLQYYVSAGNLGYGYEDFVPKK